jgi:uncharacterized membrane protein AbrB (regulator of aidB expression)
MMHPASFDRRNTLRYCALPLLSLGIETAFVATHHVSRIAMIVIAAPLVFKALGVKARKNE